jgi:CBS domain-containing protein
VRREVWSAVVFADPEGHHMRARELLVPFPTVTLDTSVGEAARLLATQDLPGLIVVDAAGLPISILPGTQVLRLAVPPYCQDDPGLARVIDEEVADVILRQFDDRPVREAMPPDPHELPVTDPRATVLEIAALMARTHSPLVAIVGENGLEGAVTLQNLMDRLVAS